MDVKKISILLVIVLFLLFCLYYVSTTSTDLPKGQNKFDTSIFHPAAF